MTAMDRSAQFPTRLTMKRAATMGMLIGGLLLSACSSTETPVVTPTVTSVTTTTPTATLTVGATQQLTATVTGTNSPATTVTWSTSNAAVATVSTSGLLTAVAAGTATVTATSTVDTTKKATITVTVNAATPTFKTVQVSFRPATSTVPAGFIADTGQGFDASRGYGWVTEATAGTATATPVDFTANPRDRNITTVAPEQSTFIHMQYTTAGTAGNSTPGAWEYTLPNGTYNVTVSVGDAGGYTDSVDTINVEGQAAITAYQPTTSALFSKATVGVTVTDGKLTVDAKGGTNTKLNYVIISAP